MDFESAERIRAVTWLTVLAAICATCLATTWNELAASVGHGAVPSVGEALVGEDERPSAPNFERRRFVSHDYQQQFQRFAAQSVPVRPILVRVHNEVLFSVLKVSPRPSVVLGHDEYMTAQAMITHYCRRSMAFYKPLMQQRVEQLKALQQHFEARQRTLLFVITPTKMARMPDKFLDHVDCPAQRAERDSIIPAYVEMLAGAGIHFVDTASLMDRLRERGVTPFPIGGVHWNMLGAAYATNAVIRALNQSARRPLLPELHWTTEASERPLFEDGDLLVGLNLLDARAYPSTRVIFEPLAACPSGKLSMTVVGGSFVVQLVRALSETQCIARGRRFAGLTRGYFEFPPEREVATGPLVLEFVAPRLDADVIILEENENVAARSLHVTAFYKLTLGATPRDQPHSQD